jgi:hypothetical protein
MKIYLACGLTHVPRHLFADYVAFIHSLAAQLSTPAGWQVRYALKDSDPQLAQRPAAERASLCYLWDRGMVEWADVVVAECSHPSTGLGIELQIAEHNGTPIVICHRRSPEARAQDVDYLNPETGQHHLQIGDGYVTLMALGIPTLFRVVPYASPEQGVLDVGATVSLLDRSSPQDISARQPGQSRGESPSTGVAAPAPLDIDNTPPQK